MKRAIVAIEIDEGKWAVQAGYVHQADWTSFLHAPSTTHITWGLGSPKNFATYSDVDWSTVPDPVREITAAPKVIEP